MVVVVALAVAAGATPAAVVVVVLVMLPIISVDLYRTRRKLRHLWGRRPNNLF